MVKILHILAALVVLAVVGWAVFDYWSNLAIFAFIPTLLLGTFHAVILASLIRLIWLIIKRT